MEKRLQMDLKDSLVIRATLSLPKALQKLKAFKLTARELCALESKGPGEAKQVRWGGTKGCAGLASFPLDWLPLN